MDNNSRGLWHLTDISGLIIQTENSTTEVLNDTADQLRLNWYLEDATSKKKKKSTKNKNNRFFSSAYGSFSGIEHTVGHKISLNKCKGTEIISSIFFDHNSMKLEINHRDQKKEKNEHMQTK